jgi:hypothetical protein
LPPIKRPTAEALFPNASWHPRIVASLYGQDGFPEIIVLRLWTASTLLLLVVLPAFAEKRSVQELTALANSHAAGLNDAITATFDEKDLREGTAWIGHGPDFFFALKADSQPTLIIDDTPGPRMQRSAGNLWYASAHIESVGRLHSFHYVVQGADFGGGPNLPAYGPLSYLQPGVPSGKLSEKIIHTSKI